MKRYEHIELLGRAFAYGEIDAFVGCMNAECKYHSDYAHKHLNTAEQIEESMRSVYATVQRKPPREKTAHTPLRLLHWQMF